MSNPTRPTLSVRHKFQPTPRDFGIPSRFIIPPHQLLINKGILQNVPGTDVWVIKGMPHLCQVDEALDAPLDKLIKEAIPSDKMPQKTDDKGNPLFENGKPQRSSVEEYRNALKGVGCYITSIVTVIITALANRSPDLKDSLINRTKIFDDIKGSDGVSREINQLAWAYLQEALNGSEVTVNGKKVEVFYFHEVVADLGAGKIKEACDPYVWGDCAQASLASNNASAFRVFDPSSEELTNERIIQMMKDGMVPMVGYSRNTPFPIPSFKFGFNGGYTFKDNGGLHKVVFNGFQSGKYPLRIYDVGNGKAYNVRISSDLNDMKFDFSKKLEGAENFDKNFLNRPFLIYEGEDEIINHQVYFIDSSMHADSFGETHYDGLKIRSGTIIETPILKDPVFKEPIIKNPILD